MYIQEEIESRTVALSISTAKLTGRIFKAAICKYLAYRKEKKLQKSRDSMARNSPVIPHGKQSVKELIGQNQGVSTIESNDPDIKAFERVARKYGVDYAVKKGRVDMMTRKMDNSGLVWSGLDNSVRLRPFCQYPYYAH